MRILLVIPGNPIAKPRAKGFFNKKTNILHHYYSSNSGIKEFEQHIRDKAFEAIKTPSELPIILKAVFIFPRPKQMIYKKKQMPREPKTTKPDYDNLLKSISDALNGIAFRDDGQVYKGTWEKYIASGNEQPRTEIEISDEE